MCIAFPSQELGAAVTHSNTEAVAASRLIFLAVKPHLVPAILREVAPHITREHVVVSVAAGVTIATLEEVRSIFSDFSAGWGV